MTRRKTFNIEVFENTAGMVVMVQNDPGQDNVIVIHPCMVDTICKWLRETRDEAIGEQETEGDV